MEGLRLERSVAPVTRAQAPATGPDLVSRPRLLALLESGAGRRLTLLSAPAGFGKTTLLADWASTAEKPVAWLSLDETDGDPAVFLADAAEALAVHRRPAALVLDDHERIAGTPGEESLWRFVAEAPSTLRIVLCGRVRPELPAGIAGDVLEIGPADLRMTDVEAAELLHRATGGSFAVREVMRQIELCEGRPAALRLVGNGGGATKQARAERNVLPRPDRLRPNPVLTEREVAVLRLLSDGRSKREIGAELTLSFNTVHSHTKAIYRKLGVSSRHEAAARAHELGVG